MKTKSCQDCKKLKNKRTLRYFKNNFETKNERKSHEQFKWRNRKIIFDQLKKLSVFALSIGLILQPVHMIELKIDQPQVNPHFNENSKRSSLHIRPYSEHYQNVSGDFKIAKAKDIAMVPDLKYRSFKSICNMASFFFY